MSHTLDRIRERVQQIDAERARRVDAELRTALERAAAGEGRFLIGTRVFDTVTGLEGDVVGFSGENIVIPAST